MNFSSYFRKIFVLSLAGILLAPFALQPLAARSDDGVKLPRILGVSERDVRAALRLRVLQPENVQYVGAFRVPGDQSNGTSLKYGGTSIAYNPQRKSLYIVGHDHQQQVTEVSIPEIVQSNTLADLQTGKILQSFADATNGKMYSLDTGSIKIGGLLVYNNRLLGTAYSYYDGDNSQKQSHFSGSLDLSRVSKVRGMFSVGNVGAGFVSGYMASVPVAWQKVFGGHVLTGNCCLAIAGRTSLGPAAFVFNPEDLGKKSSSVSTGPSSADLTPTSAQPLVYYPITRPNLGKWGETSSVYNGSTMVRGVVWPAQTSSVIFFGTHGVGNYCYGTGKECNDPVRNDKGTHAYPYKYQAWAYDAKDFLKVKSGEMQPWDMKPYAVWNFDLPFSAEWKGIGGVAYDAKNNRIFVSQLRGDDKLPVIHVFRVAPIAR